MASLALAILLAFGCEICRYRAPGVATARLAATTLVLTYIGLLMSFVVQLRLSARDDGSAGLGFAYFDGQAGRHRRLHCGCLIGRHRMAPLLSPGKTIEGGVGALIFGCFGAWLSLRVLFPLTVPPGAVGEAFSAFQWLSYGVLVGLAGIFGDLAESLLKRDLGRKDSSRWLPGFGGVLDIIDSILVAAVPAFLWWLAVAGQTITYAWQMP